MPGELGFWFHLVLAILALDFLNYALHRAMHAVPMFWRLHALHHSDLSLDVSTTVRHHPAEGIVAALFVGVSAAFLACSTFEVAVYAVLENVVQLLGHADIRTPKGIERAVREIFVTANFHRTHHSSEQRETDSNYGQAFAFWDKLFGTFGGYVSDKRDGIEFGLKQFRDDHAQRLDQLLLQPLFARRAD